MRATLYPAVRGVLLRPHLYTGLNRLSAGSPLG